MLPYSIAQFWQYAMHHFSLFRNPIIRNEVDPNVADPNGKNRHRFNSLSFSFIWYDILTKLRTEIKKFAKTKTLQYVFFKFDCWEKCVNLYSHLLVQSPKMILVHPNAKYFWSTINLFISITLLDFSLLL